MIYAPLAEAPARPDAVLLFVNAGQTLIWSEASEQVERGVPPAMGRPACAVIPQVCNTGRPALRWARAYLDMLTDDVALSAVPGASIATFTEGVKALTNTNGILSKFHQMRQRDVEPGEAPTIRQSLARLQAAG